MYTYRLIKIIQNHIDAHTWGGVATRDDVRRQSPASSHRGCQKRKHDHIWTAAGESREVDLSAGLEPRRRHLDKDTF